MKNLMFVCPSCGDEERAGLWVNQNGLWNCPLCGEDSTQDEMESVNESVGVRE